MKKLSNWCVRFIQMETLQSNTNTISSLKVAVVRTGLMFDSEYRPVSFTCIGRVNCYMAWEIL